eukprot:CAMPEP_0185731132 /NCGR_PEP_ID=MMETSP1171-20130828/11955_1 /TAXON_ID=374046 /ORGANISM="Helicotheca tamensis, Strain CCMP826" /LENGTH=567 /DNA_ID=CAMNT_0028400327 /DNA_START=49 /DNA_END=1752 /DNA_ORIENTATION=-
MMITRKKKQLMKRRRKKSDCMLVSTTVVAISAAAVLATAVPTAAMVCTHQSLPPTILPPCSPLRPALRKNIALAMSATKNDNDSTTPRKKPMTLTTLKNEIPRYIRIQPRTYRGNRRKFELQTAVTTFENINNGVSVDLHAQVHFGEPSYFNIYNNDEVFGSKYDRVHYELVVDESMLQTVDDDDNKNSLCRRLVPMADGKNPIMPSERDSRTASQYGLSCQVDMINYGRSDKWIHADFTREEFIRETTKPATAAATRGNNNVANDSNAIFSLASTAANAATSLPGAEVFAALFRPATPSTPVTSRVTRRLFSNLFLPGDALTSAMRALLWTAVPCPEVSVLLLDWSSLLPRPGGGISPVAIPVLECLLTGNLMEARRLVFSQMVVSGQSAEENSDRAENVIVGRRNARALDVLTKSIERDGCRKNALLYGGMHCRDLHRRLRDAGYVPKQTVWRTAWSVDVPNFGTGNGKNDRGITGPVIQPAVFTASSSPAAIAAGLVAVPLYLAVGGLDWIATVRDVSGTIENGQVFDGVLEVALYLIRHVALYLGLAKFVVEWDEIDLFGGDD